jgi:hypothetical protein
MTIERKEEKKEKRDNPHGGVWFCFRFFKEG